jgi:hypothetical protein
MRRTANLRLAVGVKTFMYAAAGGEETFPIRRWFKESRRATRRFVAGILRIEAGGGQTPILNTPYFTVVRVLCIQLYRLLYDAKSKK